MNANEFQALAGDSKPSVLVHNSVAQTFTTSSLTPTVYDTDLHDRWGMHNTSSATDRLTIQIPGIYLFFADIIYASNSTGIRRLVLESYNSSASLINRYAFQSFTAVNVDATGVNVFAMTQALIAGDFLRCKGLQTSGGDLDSVGSVSGSIFGATWHSRG